MIHETRKLPAIYLKPGELYINDHPGIVTTVLGSCVSVTLYSPRNRAAAICHGMMPRWEETERDKGPHKERFKYVDYAIRYMMKVFRSFGLKPREIEVKLFGGANLFSSADDGGPRVPVGRQNVITALEVMEEEGLVLARKDVGGMQGRKLHFYLHTGEVFVKKLETSEQFDIIML
jgi:chemotaxis protein CheD